MEPPQHRRGAGRGRGENLGGAGTRDSSVTGVQTCALPIFPPPTAAPLVETAPQPRREDSVRGSPCDEPARLRLTSLRPPPAAAAPCTRGPEASPLPVPRSVAGGSSDWADRRPFRARARALAAETGAT